MTKEIIHICCSDSARGSIKHAIKKGLLQGKEAIGLTDDLSNGPINEITIFVWKANPFRCGMDSIRI